MGTRNNSKHFVYWCTTGSRQYMQPLEVICIISEAQKRAVEKYNAAHYKQAKIRFSYKESEMFHKLAIEQNKSFNSFVVDTLIKAIKQEKEPAHLSPPAENANNIHIDNEVLEKYKNLAKERNITVTFCISKVLSEFLSDDTIILTLDKATATALATYGNRQKPPLSAQDYVLAYCKQQRELFEMMEENYNSSRGEYGGFFRRN